MGSEIISRLSGLRTYMKENGISACLFKTQDPHASEYISDHYKEREYFSGFTGSNGDLLVGLDRAWLWTDGRYFVQAKKELDGSGILLMRTGQAGVPELLDAITDTVNTGDTVAVNGKLIGATFGKDLYNRLAKRGVTLRTDFEIPSFLWNDRKEDPSGAIRILPEELCGESVVSKIGKIRTHMRKEGADAYILSKLDDQMWLFNIRGCDIAFNPVAYAYTYISDDSVYLFLKNTSVTKEIVTYLNSSGVTVLAYDEFYDFLHKTASKVAGDKAFLIDPANTNYEILTILSGQKLIFERNITEDEKARKNPTEIRYMKEVYKKDSAVLARFLHDVKVTHGKTPMTEVTLQEDLDHRRSEIPGFFDLSFTTISAFGPNAAMMHYEATKEDHSEIGSDGLYLVDSGGQYDGGTTDVTRTLILGNVSEEIKRQFTRVVIGMLHLQNAVFLKGCTGRNLDILAREPLWKTYMDYKCGTGHGIGYMLNVHEGPHNIRWKYTRGASEAVLLPGMIVSDEPGVYVAGSHGIRIENILLCKEGPVNDDGTFLYFEPLTWVPIDLDGIVLDEMTSADREMLNSYHQKVFETISPYLSKEDEEWLRQATRAI